MKTALRKFKNAISRCLVLMLLDVGFHHYRDWFSYGFGPTFGLALNRGGYFDSRYNITIGFFFVTLFIYLPIKTRRKPNDSKSGYYQYGFATTNISILLYSGPCRNTKVLPLPFRSIVIYPDNKVILDTLIDGDQLLITSSTARYRWTPITTKLIGVRYLNQHSAFRMAKSVVGIKRDNVKDNPDYMVNVNAKLTDYLNTANKEPFTYVSAELINGKRGYALLSHTVQRPEAHGAAYD